MTGRSIRWPDEAQLRHALAGSWSRRISEEHRLVYLVDGEDRSSCRGATTTG